MNLFGQQPTWGVTELSRELKCSKNSAFQALDTLLKEGYLVRSSSGPRYQLAHKVLNFGSTAESTDVRSLCHPTMQRIHELTSESVFLAILVYLCLTGAQLDGRGLRQRAGVPRGSDQCEGLGAAPAGVGDDAPHCRQGGQRYVGDVRGDRVRRGCRASENGDGDDHRDGGCGHPQHGQEAAQGASPRGFGGNLDRGSHLFDRYNLAVTSVTQTTQTGKLTGN